MACRHPRDTSRIRQVLLRCVRSTNGLMPRELHMGRETRRGDLCRTTFTQEEYASRR
jgi:hypothetical protein